MGTRGGRGVPPLKIFLLTPPRKRQKFGNKTEEFIDPPANFQGPYVVNLILYVVTENFYDPPPMSFDPRIPMRPTHQMRIGRQSFLLNLCDLYRRISREMS